MDPLAEYLCRLCCRDDYSLTAICDEAHTNIHTIIDKHIGEVSWKL